MHITAPRDGDDRHPDFKEWADDVMQDVDYDGMTENWTEEDHQFVGQAQSLEDFYNRIHHVDDHYQYNPYADYTRKEGWLGGDYEIDPNSGSAYPFQYGLPEPLPGKTEVSLSDWEDWWDLPNPTSTTTAPLGWGVDEAWQQKNASEPMDIAWRLLKGE